MLAMHIRVYCAMQASKIVITTGSFRETNAFRMEVDTNTIHTICRSFHNAHDVEDIESKKAYK